MGFARGTEARASHLHSLHLPGIYTNLPYGNCSLYLVITCTPSCPISSLISEDIYCQGLPDLRPQKAFRSQSLQHLQSKNTEVARPQHNNPSAENPKPQTLDPEPETLNPSPGRMGRRQQQEEASSGVSPGHYGRPLPRTFAAAACSYRAPPITVGAGERGDPYCPTGGFRGLGFN